MNYRAGRAIGVLLDNTWRSSFDVGRERADLLTFGAVNGELDYYFINGPDPKQVIERYTALTGRMPLSHCLAHPWYETPNIHLCTIADFTALAEDMGARVERALALGENGRTHVMHPHAWGPNLFAEGAIFLLRSKDA